MCTLANEVLVLYSGEFSWVEIFTDVSVQMTCPLISGATCQQ